jgi:hypothetical protein
MLRYSSRLCLLAIALVLSPGLLAHDLADGYLRARAIVGRHLDNVKLNSAYGTPAFDASGRQVGDIFLNFSGQDKKGRWMLMSLTLKPGGELSGEGESSNPRLDQWGHYQKPAIELEAWFPPEEGVAIAIKRHPGHEPAGAISLAYRNSSEFNNRVVIILYWEQGHAIRDAVLDGRYGTVLQVNETPWPGNGKLPDRMPASLRPKTTRVR